MDRPPFDVLDGIQVVLDLVDREIRRQREAKASSDLKLARAKLIALRETAMGRRVLTMEVDNQYRCAWLVTNDNQRIARLPGQSMVGMERDAYTLSRYTLAPIQIKMVPDEYYVEPEKSLRVLVEAGHGCRGTLYDPDFFEGSPTPQAAPVATIEAMTPAGVRRIVQGLSRYTRKPVEFEVVKKNKGGGGDD